MISSLYNLFGQNEENDKKYDLVQPLLCITILVIYFKQF